MSLTVAEKRKSLITSFFILVSYVFIFHLSAIVLIIPPVADFAYGLVDASGDDAVYMLSSWWSFIAGIITIAIIFIATALDKPYYRIFDGEKASTGEAIGWGILGFFMVLFGQYVAAILENLIGIEPGSENTANLVGIAEVAPIMVLVIIFIAPILEEVVFRRVIFGTMIQFQGFWISAIISALVFALIHLDFTHILVYLSGGLIFAYLYYKTKRLLTTIIAHMLLNSFVAVMNLYYDQIVQFIK